MRAYFRNFDTNGDVSPCRMKCPDGPSPRNSLNHDSCSTSSFSIARERSYVRWSLPAVMLQKCEYPATTQRSAFTRIVSIALMSVGLSVVWRVGMRSCRGTLSCRRGVCLPVRICVERVLRVIAIFNSSGFSDLFDSFTFQSD